MDSNRNILNVHSNSKLNVLLVDSEEIDLHLLAVVLGRAGLEPVLATSGEEALRLLDAQPFDLAIVDEDLAGAVDGAEVVRKADSIVPPVPVVLTGFRGTGEESWPRPRNVSSYLPKPYDPRRLNDEVRGVVVTLGEMSRRSRAPSSAPPPHSRTTVPPPFRVRRRESFQAADTDVAVLVVEKDARIRGAILKALAEAGSRAVAFATAAQAEHHVRHEGYNVLVARAEVLEANPHWRELAVGAVPLGAIAIAADEDEEDGVRAAYQGARGAFEPPWDPRRVTAQFRQALAIMRDEIRRRSTIPPAR